MIRTVRVTVVKCVRRCVMPAAVLYASTVVGCIQQYGRVLN